MSLSPPALPPFLADRFELKTIEGVPGDEDVKTVHAVIKALNDAMGVPGLYDADLAMKLSGYLFSIQMTRYRENHPIVIFPTDTIHTPPTLPAHILVELKPVTGAPKDEEVKNTQEALRIAENMVHIPSMFDADLSMKLSQHLFNIQFERYIHQAASGHPAISTSQPPNDTRPQKSAERTSIREASAPQEDLFDTQPEPFIDPFLSMQLPFGNASTDSAPAERTSVREASAPQEDLFDTQPEPFIDPFLSMQLPFGNASTDSAPAESNPSEEGSCSSGHQIDDCMESVNIGIDTNKLLARIANRLDDMKQFMVEARHSMAMSLNDQRLRRPSQRQEEDFYGLLG